ncbi:MAG: hypothetical protein ACT4QD_10170 [Acidobacteriota bacterium]
MTRLVLVCLALIGLFRLTLLGRGASALGDETLYFTSVMSLQRLSTGDVRRAASSIAEARGRQGAAVILLPIAALQAIPSAFGVTASNPRSLLIPTVLNVFVSLVTLYVFFKLCLVLTRDARVALSTMVAYGLLVNSNLYLRHLLPYEWALCAGVLAMWLTVSGRRTTACMAIAGALTGAMVTMYVGYYLLAAAVGIAAVAPRSPADWRPVPRRVAVFAAGFASVIAAVELLCRAGGVSFIESSRALSRTITHGAFSEGWTFLPAYLLEVERQSGVLLLGATTVAMWRLTRALRRRALGAFEWLLISGMAAWAWQAAESAEWQRMVMYGRTIRPWLLVMALALATTMAAIPRPRLRALACTAAVAVAVVSWVGWAAAYYRLAYPPDVLYSLGIDSKRLTEDRMRCEFTVGMWYASPGPLDRATGYPYTTDSNLLLLNFCHGAPSLPRPSIAEEGAESQRLYDGPHWLTFPAYGFEGQTPEAREALARGDYRVRVYRMASSPPAGRAPATP